VVSGMNNVLFASNTITGSIGRGNDTSIKLIGHSRKYMATLNLELSTNALLNQHLQTKVKYCFC